MTDSNDNLTREAAWPADADGSMKPDLTRLQDLAAAAQPDA